MGRTKRPDLTALAKAPADAASRGVRVFSPEDVGAVVRVARTRVFGRRADAVRRLGVSRNLLAGLEQGTGGTHLRHALTVLADLGFDVVLVPRDPNATLREEPQ